MVLFFVGLVLAIPLSVLGNVLTPHVLRWWATTSLVRREYRIETLGRQIRICRILIHPLVRRESFLKAIRTCIVGTCVSIFIFTAGLFPILDNQGKVLMRFLVYDSALKANLAKEAAEYHLLNNSQHFIQYLSWTVVMSAAVFMVFLLISLYYLDRASKVSIAKDLASMEVELKNLCG